MAATSTEVAMSITRRLVLLAAAAAPVAGSLPALAQTMSPQSASRPAIGGYDTVAYFTVGKPQHGDPAIAHTWDGRRYLFASEQHRQLFVADPEKYAPQFAGSCAAGLASGHKVEADPTNWLISDGRLYLFFAGYGPDKMRDDPTMAARADAAWKKEK
jgi:hypothetical protein